MSKKKPAKKLTNEQKADQLLESYVIDMSKTLCDEVFAIIGEEYQDKGPEVARLLTMAVIKTLIASAVYSPLSDPKSFLGVRDPELTEAKRVEASYALVKNDIQAVVADGFELATSTYSGKDSEYYCKVGVVGPCANKELI